MWSSGNGLMEQGLSQKLWQWQTGVPVWHCAGTRSRWTVIISCPLCASVQLWWMCAQFPILWGWPGFTDWAHWEYLSDTFSSKSLGAPNQMWILYGSYPGITIAEANWIISVFWRQKSSKRKVGVQRHEPKGVKMKINGRAQIVRR